MAHMAKISSSEMEVHEFIANVIRAKRSQRKCCDNGLLIDLREKLAKSYHS